MAEQSKIEWCDATFNPWIGCTKVSPACDHCYAEVNTAARVHGVTWGAGQPRHRTKTWADPVRWNKQAFCECMSCGWRGESRECLMVKNPAGFYPPVDSMSACPSCKQPSIKAARRRVFCASLADVFDNEVPGEWREDLFDLIRLTPNLEWLLLTKRPQNIIRMVQTQGAIADNGNRYIPDNVWLGTTVCTQKEADRNIPALLKTREAINPRVLFLSLEPLLGPIDLVPMFEHRAEVHNDTGVHWVIAGGESGPHARPSHPDWFRSLRGQCAAAGVPFLFKQWGEWAPGENCGGPMTRAEKTASLFSDKWRFSTMTPKQSEECDVYDAPELFRVGKKISGRLLDGVEHNEFPKGYL